MGDEEFGTDEAAAWAEATAQQAEPAAEPAPDEGHPDEAAPHPGYAEDSVVDRDDILPTYEENSWPGTDEADLAAQARRRPPADGDGQVLPPYEVGEWDAGSTIPELQGHIQRVVEVVEQAVFSTAQDDDRLAQDLEYFQHSLGPKLDAAHGSAEALQSTWPLTDQAGCRSLAGELDEISGLAANAGDRAGDLRWDARDAFHGARDQASWAASKAREAAEGDIADQKGALDELPGLIAQAQALVAGVVPRYSFDVLAPHDPPPMAI